MTFNFIGIYTKISSAIAYIVMFENIYSLAIDKMKNSNIKTCSIEFEYVLQEEFEDTKVVIGIRKSKKDRQHNCQKKKDKRTNNDLQNIHIKLKIE